MSYSRCRATDPRPSLMGYQARVSAVRRQVRGAMEIALFIQNIQVSTALLLVTCVRSVTRVQEERAEVALYIFTNQSIAATAAQREANRLVCSTNCFVLNEVYLMQKL